MSVSTLEALLSRPSLLRLGAVACVIPLATGLAACKDNPSGAAASASASASAATGADSENGAAGAATMSEDTETPSAAPTSTAQALPAAQAQGIDQAFVQQALQANIDALDDPTASVDMSTVLTGTALEELDSQRMEWENNGWHQDGTVTVLSAELQPSADPSEAVVKACVDSSDLRLLDENNNEVNGDVPANEQRSLMLITFRNEDGTWKLADRQFPDDPHC